MVEASEGRKEGNGGQKEEKVRNRKGKENIGS